MEIKEDKYDFIIKMVLTTFIGSGLLYGVVLILSLAIKKPITLGESLSYFGAVLTAVVTIFGVMWQIQKNNEQIDKEKKEKEVKEKENLLKYLEYIISKNLNNLRRSSDFLYEIILLQKGTNGKTLKHVFYEFDKEYMSRNIEIILNLEKCQEILELSDKLNEIKNLINIKLNEFYIPKELTYLMRLRFSMEEKGVKDSDMTKKFVIDIHNTLFAIKDIIVPGKDNNEILEQLNIKFKSLAILLSKNDVYEFKLKGNSYKEKFELYIKTHEYLYKMLSKIKDNSIVRLIFIDNEISNMVDSIGKEFFYFIQLQIKTNDIIKEMEEIRDSLRKQQDS